MTPGLSYYHSTWQHLSRWLCASCRAKNARRRAILLLFWLCSSKSSFRCLRACLAAHIPDLICTTVSGSSPGLESEGNSAWSLQMASLQSHIHIHMHSPAQLQRRVNPCSPLNLNAAFNLKGNGLPTLELKRKSRVLTIKAVATPVRESSDTSEIPEISLNIPGFTQIGEPVPEGLSLNDVVKTLPKEVFEVDDVKAAKTILITVAAITAGYAALAVAPWYLYPIVYAFLGTAVTGLFVIGHDCGHNSFSKSQLVNDVVGTLVFAPLIYPFEPWRLKHNTHHAHTNKLVMDTAWQPFRPHHYDNGGPVVKRVFEATMGPFWWVASVGHWLFWHFDMKKFRPQEIPKVKVSLAAVGAFAALVLVPLMVTQGPVGFVKWWLVPWLGFHFWMSTFTMVHHTAPHIPFKSNREWYAVEAQLNGTVHCEYPAWIDLLCHDISVHIPHHVSTKIPSYNLRKAYAAIQDKWDKHLNKAEFGIPLMSSILSQCNLFDAAHKKWVKFNKSEREAADAVAS